jgi:threonine/homoserine/homoserine lactone efflux protein
MNKTQPTQAVSPAASANGFKKAVAPAAGALVGTSAMVLLVELARSGALEQYKDLVAPLIGWGPGLLILMAFLWLAHSYAPPLIESQRSTATALQKLADTVEHNATNQHDLVLAMQVNSDKLEQLRGTVNDLQEHVQQLKEDWRHGRTQ